MASLKKKTNRPTPAEPAWTPMSPATVQGRGLIETPDGISSVWMNSRYTVLLRRVQAEPACEPIVHLSIRRNDRRPIANWRDLQRIKNELVGSQCEGLQIFPAEDRLVDTSNQYHLYVFTNPAYRIGIGYRERLVAELPYGNSVQEPFEPHVRPDDLETGEQLAERIRELNGET